MLAGQKKKENLSPPPELYQLRQGLSGDFPSPPTLSSFLLSLCFPSQLSVIVWMIWIICVSPAQDLTQASRACKPGGLHGAF